MSTTPATVTVTAFNAYKASALIGGDTALGDNSDATFAEVWTSTRVDNAVQDHIAATFPAVTSTGTLAAVSLIARVEYATVDGATQRRFDVEAQTPTTSLGAFLHAPIESGSTVPATGTIYTITDWTYSGSLTSTQTALAAGEFQIDLSALSDGTPPATPPADWMLRVYELELVLAFVSPCNQTLTATTVSAWSDGNDATSEVLGVSGATYAGLDPYVGPTVLDLTAVFRASSTETGDSSITSVEVGDSWDGTAFRNLATSGSVSVPNDGVVRDYSVTFTSTAESFATITTALAASGNAVLMFNTSSPRSVFIHEASLRVGHKCYVLSTMRKYPNSTGTGVGPARHWPRPRRGITGIR